jgi:pyruvate/2-oxoglutarate dehydrogenase complex dihydrolipoamide acyltransferase (E2) component
VEEGGPVQRGTRIAIIETSIGHFAVTTNGDGFLREKLFPAGSVIEARNSIAVVAADGENIPYNRPYSQAERVDAIG